MPALTPPHPRHVIDLTIPITSGMDAFPGEPSATFTRFSSVDDGGIEMWDVAIFSQLGTHVDAPNHFIKDGGGVDRLAVMSLVGPATVLHLTADSDSISTSHLLAREDDIRRHRRVLINTGWDRRIGTPDYWTDFPELSVAAAQLLVDWGVLLIGVDTPTPSMTHLHEMHRLLLGAQIVVAECVVNLHQLPDSTFVVCAPLPLVGLDGSPARILAIDFDNEGTPTS